MYGPDCRRPILYTALMTWKPASCTYIGWEEKQIKKIILFLEGACAALIL